MKPLSREQLKRSLRTQGAMDRKAVARTLLLLLGEPELIRADPNGEAFSSGTRIDKDES
ncbi:MAG: hypothetical protein JO313_03485 [Verrucomicrobia bacterium]|nr:hypothetical protein [Verrucomicrobiota bacterium]